MSDFNLIMVIELSFRNRRAALTPILVVSSVKFMGGSGFTSWCKVVAIYEVVSSGFRHFYAVREDLNY